MPTPTNLDPTLSAEGTSTRISRRTLTAGAAWSVPVLATAAAAPAFAASPTACTPAVCLVASDTAFGTSNTATNGWKLSTTGSFYGGGDQSIGWYNGFSYKKDMTSYKVGTTTPCPGATTSSTTVTLTGATVVAQGDPASNPSAPGSTVTWAKPFLCLEAGKTYNFTYKWISYGINTLAAHQYTYITPGNTPAGTSGTQLGTVITAAAHTDNASGTRTVSFTPTVSGQYTFYFLWTFDAAASYPKTDSCETYANDFAINAPVVTCS